MDKAIIFGAFEFVGFYLCKEFLERGYEVTGILLDHSAKNFNEEKRFEIGRNANFKEKTMEEWEQFEYDDTSNSLIILSLYDLFMGSKEKLLKRDVLSKPLFQNNENGNQLICILPVQTLNQCLPSNEMDDLKAFLDIIKEMRRPIQFYHLPSIFGPWQPTEFVFQKSMLSRLKETKEQSQKREWKKDAIFVEDAIKTIIEKIETGSSGQFIVESGLTNRWEECADFLKIDLSFRHSTDPQELYLDDQIIRLTLKNVTPISDSLTMQREHLKYLQSLFN